MLRSAAGKVMWVGRATVFLVGLAVILALVFGAASTALGANGKPFLLGKKNVASAISTLVKQGTGPALKLQVGAGQPPLAVNSSATVADLSADRLDGEDSDQILPLVRAQRDSQPLRTYTQSGDAPTENVGRPAVEITAPTDGVLVISGSMTLRNLSSVQQNFVIQGHLDGNITAARTTESLGPSSGDPVDNIAVNATEWASAGQHTVTLDINRTGGSGDWQFADQNLTVMFVPAGRSHVYDSIF